MIGRIVAGTVRLVTGVRVLDEAPQGDAPAIYFSNHTSHLDFVVIWSALPAGIRGEVSPAAAEDYWSKTALRRKLACDVFRAVLIAREGISKENNPLERLGSVLEEGRSIIIFPEGTRRSDGQVGEFKAGLYHLAKRYPDVPLVPVYLENLNRILPKGSHLFVPLIAQAHFREPVFLMDGESKTDFLYRARVAMLAT